MLKAIIRNARGFQLRRYVQFFFLSLVLWLGFDFYRFVSQFETGGSYREVAHPGGVEAFLPIGGFTSLRYWMQTGEIHYLHPASMMIFIAAVLVSALLTKSFCGWICPVGFISEFLYKPWQKFFGKNVQLPNAANIALRSIKYILLAFFVVMIGFFMSIEQVTEFLQGDYWKAADVKMLYFFTKMSTTSLIVTGVLVLLSIPIRNFWCRFLCPYGALMGVVGLVSPFKIRRDPALCNNCRACTRNCPAHLQVATSAKITSPECISCFTCKDSCKSGALSYSHSLPFVKKTKRITPIHVAVAVLGIFFFIVGIAKFTENWDATVSSKDLKRIIPSIESLEHPR